MHIEKQKEGAPGFEPGTSRSAVECSTTELYPQMILLDQFCILKCIGWQQQNKIGYTSMNIIHLYTVLLIRVDYYFQMRYFLKWLLALNLFPLTLEI